MLSQHARLDARKRELDETEYESEVRTERLEEVSERLDPSAIVDDFLSYAQSKLRGVSKMVFEKFRGLISDWSRQWSRTTRDGLYGRADESAYDVSFYHDRGVSSGRSGHGHGGLG